MSKRVREADTCLGRESDKKHKTFNRMLDLLTSEDIGENVLDFLDGPSLAALQNTSKELNLNDNIAIRETCYWKLEKSRRRLIKIITTHILKRAQELNLGEYIYPHLCASNIKYSNISLCNDAKTSIKQWLQTESKISIDEKLYEVQAVRRNKNTWYGFKDQQNRDFIFGGSIDYYIRRANGKIPEPQQFQHLCALVDYLCPRLSLYDKLERACAFITHEMSMEFSINNYYDQ